MKRVIVIGAGMGGLLAALRLARHGYAVRLLEARDAVGGLASAQTFDGWRFDAGPYVLLDRPGLEWACAQVGLNLADLAPLRQVTDIYEVESADGPPVRFRADLDATAAGLEAAWPGSGARYRAFVAATAARYARLQPLQRVSRPNVLTVLHSGAWRDVPFLFRSLRAVLRPTGLPEPVVQAIAIWTHVAGQTLEAAPSPLAFVPALFHSVGAYYPVDGLGALPQALAEAVRAAGVDLRLGMQVRAIRCRAGRAEGVVTADGEMHSADAVLSNAPGVGTYLELADGTPAPVKEQLGSLPLQSPGVCAYLVVRGPAEGPYLRFRLPGGGELCRLLIRPATVVPELARDGWHPARLLAPMRHAEAERLGPDGQRQFLDRILAEPWWRQGLGEVRVLETRTPAEWGRQFLLFRDSMNPVMTAAFMRAGRLAHRSPHVRGLYLAGSATHPGQWVSFCAVSGVLAADRLREDVPC